MGIINKMCCLSLMVFSYDLAVARTAMDAYFVNDIHFDDTSRQSTEFINNDEYNEPTNLVPELWVFGA